MTDPLSRNLGTQPLATLLEQEAISHHDLVATNPVALTHKLIARAVKGRRLTPHSQRLVLTALNTAAGRDYTLSDLFTY